MAYKLVREPWEMHDTLCVCRTLYGSESNAGYFTTFAAFGATNRHLFFKRRSEGNVHRAYCNMQSEDRTDFVMHLFSIGLMFYAPPTPFDVQTYGPGDPIQAQEYLPSFWTQELPRHSSAILKVGQDKKLELQSMMLSPGYGAMADGAALGIDDMVPDTVYLPEMVWATCQGIPTPSARYQLFVGDPASPDPIAIPQGETIELELSLSEQATSVLQQVGGPGSLFIGQNNQGPDPAAVGQFAPSRCGIQASLWGYRSVQQRGELRAPGVR